MTTPNRAAGSTNHRCIFQIHLALFVIVFLGQLLAVFVPALNSMLTFLQGTGMACGFVGALHTLWALVRGWAPGRGIWALMLVAWVVLFTLPGILFAIGMSLGGVG